MAKLTKEKIEKKLARECEDNNMFFSHAPDLLSGRILWLDTDTGNWCVNQFSVNGSDIEVSAMPVEMYERSN